jgi:hypothetical protein
MKLKLKFWKITDNLGWIFCELGFLIVNKFYKNKESKGLILDLIVTLLFDIGCWFYSINKEHE